MLKTNFANTRSSELGLAGSKDLDASRNWFDRAKKVLAGGISSSARSTTTGDLPFPLYIARGLGPRIWDADGHQFIDYLLSYGACILGHGNPELVEILQHQLDLGTMFGTCNTLEVELAEQICQMVPCAELVRYANSGSEAIQGAIRAARGYTGKNKILKFEGHYHGWVDVLAISNRPGEAESGPIDAPRSLAHSKGMPDSIVREVVIAPWNDPEHLTHILDRHDGELAAMICEPIVANNACVMPQPGYLEFLRSQCDRRGIVLIYDEICTGFRTSPGGAQDLFGVIPDIATYSKAIGGGLPIAAFAGKRKIMDLIGANTVKHGGTYNGSPLCAASALHVLRKLNQPDTQARIAKTGQTIADTIKKEIHDRKLSAVVQGVSAMFQLVFNSDGRPLQQYRDVHRTDQKKYAAFRQSLLEQGIHINSSGLACWFISAAHTDEDVEITCRAVRNAFAEIA